MNRLPIKPSAITALPHYHDFSGNYHHVHCYEMLKCNTKNGLALEF